MTDLEPQIATKNVEIKRYKEAIQTFGATLDMYNMAIKTRFQQMADWERYSWFDAIFVWESAVVYQEVPESRPTKPIYPAPADFPDSTTFKWIEGGVGMPQSGEISLEKTEAGTSKYFGVFGQTATAGDYGMTIDGDVNGECKPRFVAINVDVFEAGPALTDEIVFDVSLQS